MENNDSKTMLLMQTILPQIPEGAFEEMANFGELMMVYHSAIREVTTKLEILNDELSLSNELSLNNTSNPIQFIKSRVKKPLSIMDKLNRLEKDINVESIMDSLNDVAGIRVVCSFIDDVYKIANMLIKQDDIVLLEIKDYIKEPKPNGYRSYHLIIEIPVFFSNKKQFVKVEIQIRTVAMDFWASLEHQLKYKNNLEGAKAIEERLKICAETISNTDLEMMSIKKQIEEK